MLLFLMCVRLEIQNEMAKKNKTKNNEIHCLNRAKTFCLVIKYFVSIVKHLLCYKITEHVCNL